MDCDVKPHQFPEVLVFETKLVGVVSTVVERAVSFRDFRLVTILIVEHNRCDSRSLGTNIESVFIGCLPVLGLVDTTLVSLGKVRVWLAHHNTCTELSHRVHIFREGRNQFFLFFGELAAIEDFFLKRFDFRLRRELASQ